MTVRVLNLPEFTLDCGARCREFKLVYALHGTLNRNKDNAILFPTYYTGTHEDNARLIGPGRALDTDRYCVLVPNLFGNGESSSPSNAAVAMRGPEFPIISVKDNVKAQAILLDQLGIDKLALVLGWSMGGVQSYQWCAQYPDRVARALIICATARTSQHNFVFLEGVKRALMADPEFANGCYQQPPEQGLRAFGSVYCGWAYSQAFFRHDRYRELGFANVQELLQSWETDHLGMDANNLLSMLDTWQQADIAKLKAFNGDLQLALRAIDAHVWLMPCEQDLYFRHEDNLAELPFLKNGKYCGFTSDFGHCAAGPGRFEKETQLIEQTIARLLATGGS